METPNSSSIALLPMPEARKWGEGKGRRGGVSSEKRKGGGEGEVRCTRPAVHFGGRRMPMPLHKERGIEGGKKKKGFGGGKRKKGERERGGEKSDVGPTGPLLKSQHHSHALLIQKGKKKGRGERRKKSLS